MLEFPEFQPAEEKLFFRSQKTGDPRFGESVRVIQSQKPQPGDFLIAGYPDDEGIQLNNGRRGASKAPQAIRSRFYKMSKSEFFNHNSQLIDIGNIDPQLALSDRHEAVKHSVEKALNAGLYWIGLGGGHDYGYPDGAGFLKAQKNSPQKPLVINFDAHLDVRPTDKGLSSGTPFFRLLNDSELPEFDFFQVGIQRQCNSQKHIEWAKDNGAKILFYEDMMMTGDSLLKTLSQFFAEILVKKRPTYISVDIDCFSTAYAMGCSQAWPTGFSPNDLLPFLNLAFNRWDVKALGIYEVSPPLDQDERTVKLASQIIHSYVGPIR